MAAEQLDKNAGSFTTSRKDYDGLGDSDTPLIDHLHVGQCSKPDVALGSSSTPVRQHVLDLRSCNTYPEAVDGEVRLRRLQEACELVNHDPYCMPLHLFIGIEYLGLGYPDLAAGATYKALLLVDALSDESDEYHEVATNALQSISQDLPPKKRSETTKDVDVTPQEAATDEADASEPAIWLKQHYTLIMYRTFLRSLLLCGCMRSAALQLERALSIYPEDPELLAVQVQLKLRLKAFESQVPADWPDHGLVRREIYPWNTHEADRLTKLDTLNEMMAQVSEKLEVRAAILPDLAGDPGSTVTQIGLFAKEDVLPGEVVLNETSLLTANNKLRDALCDACSAELPELHKPGWEALIQCPDCEVVFCSESCHNDAESYYHPALCDKDVEAIAKDVPPAEAADALYSLLLLRTLAMAETQDRHPLDLHEVKFIWGDFVKAAAKGENPYKDSFDPTRCEMPRTLPFSFEHNIRLPYHMLEKMDIDIFASPQYDVWVLNTLYAKFRGTASARLSGLGGRPIRGPEVSAVHPMWCLANHSCDPNVSWEWGGSIKFWAREELEMADWTRDGEVKRAKSHAGLRKGEEIRNHYCDITLPVHERREWARGALGGDCQCDRCVWESKA